MEKENDFPWRIYDQKSLDNEYTRLRKNIRKKITFPIPCSRIGFKYNNVFFQYERMTFSFL